LVSLSFGNFSGEVIEQIRNASPEDIQLARVLVASIRPDIEIGVSGQSLACWTVTNGSFQMTAKVRDIELPLDDAAVVATCHEVIVPMMAAMAELIGYDLVDEPPEQEGPALEGAVLQSLVLKRERNPRNRLLAIRLHGEKCFACGLEPLQLYGEAGSIIEVHHLEPVSLLAEPRPYDPLTDLVPLCPNCHRAVHTRRPLPFSIHEIQGLMGMQSD
jgi:5-methylcytosine-specific restriction protein A